MCVSGSILTQTFDIQVISYDGTLHQDPRADEATLPPVGGQNMAYTVTNYHFGDDLSHLFRVETVETWDSFSLALLTFSSCPSHPLTTCFRLQQASFRQPFFAGAQLR